MTRLLYSNGSIADSAEQRLPVQADLGVGHFTSFCARRIGQNLVTLALDRHIHRLKSAGEFFSKLNIRTPSSDELLDTLSRARHIFVKQTQCDAHVRVTCWRERWDVTLSPIDSEHMAKTLSLYPVKCVRPLPEFKTCSAISSVYANAVAHLHGFDEALFIDSDFTVRESGWGNLGWFCKRGILHFTADGVLPGITEEIVCRLARARSIEIKRHNYSLEAIMENIQAAFITTSVRGIVEVSRIGDILLSPGYPSLELITKHFQDPVWWHETGTSL
jgi:branched-subunit amino acid aminotransferase/4-amino-4-deoxychorismate lyase